MRSKRAASTGRPASNWQRWESTAFQPRTFAALERAGKTPLTVTIPRQGERPLRVSLDDAKLAALRAKLVPDGALWIVRPKGSGEISETDVMKAGKAAGLVDVKVVRFSDTHTAEKFVIPVARR